MNQDNSSSLNWLSVLNFLEHEYSSISIREKQWQLQKQSLQEHIGRLQGELLSNNVYSQDLLNRIKLLQLALFQQKSHRTPIKTLNVDHEMVDSLIDKYKLQNQVEDETKHHKQFISKFMKDVLLMSDFKGRRKNKLDFRKRLSSTHMIDSKGSILQEYSSVKGNIQPVEKYQVSAHLDAIRDIEINNRYIMTVSDDCIAKVWDKSHLQANEHIDPIITLRQHTGPLLCLASVIHEQECWIFTAGSQAYIKCWSMPLDNPKKIIDSYTLSNSDPNQDNTIWSLHLLQNKLLSCCSDGLIRFFQVSNLTGQLKQQFQEKQFNQICASWVSPNTFLSGCQNAPRLTLWDVHGKICQKFLYEIDKGKNCREYQTNHVVNNMTYKLVVGGCEDSNIRIFDFNGGKIIKKIGHSNAITGLQFKSEWQLISSANDGNVISWDLRMFKTLWTLKASHIAKYDEVINCLKLDGEALILGGADGYLSIYH